MAEDRRAEDGAKCNPVALAVAPLAALLALAGCAVVSATSTVVGTAVDVGATAVETTVDIGAGAVDLAVGDDDEDDD